MENTVYFRLRKSRTNSVYRWSNAILVYLIEAQVDKFCTPRTCVVNVVDFIIRNGRSCSLPAIVMHGPQRVYFCYILRWFWCKWCMLLKFAKKRRLPSHNGAQRRKHPITPNFTCDKSRKIPKQRKLRTQKQFNLALLWTLYENILILLSCSHIAVILIAVAMSWQFLNISPVCPRGRYGLQCRHTCRCQNGALCDPKDGKCNCGLGWTGPECDTG